jgi:hypothetical protein
MVPEKEGIKPYSAMQYHPALDQPHGQPSVWCYQVDDMMMTWWQNLQLNK